MISSENYGGQSGIHYFTTLPGTPDKVRDLEVVANSSSDITISWSPPKRFNGIPDFYIVAINITDSSNIINIRDYCIQPLKEGEDFSTKPNVVKPDNTKTCNCEDYQCKTVGPKPSEEEIIGAISFEDKIHDRVYIKYSKPGNARKRRDTSSIFDAPHFQASTLLRLMGENVHHIDENFDEKNMIIFKKVMTNSTHITLKQLKHYSSYSIDVRACRKEDLKEKELKNTPDNCSPPAYKNVRTKMIPGADNITEFTALLEQTNSSWGAIKTVWTPPSDPNGVIVSYSLKYHRVDGDTKVRPQCITATKFELLGKAFVIQKLEPGNYSVQVMATSMYGDGAYTEPRYIEIPEPVNHTTAIIIVAMVIMLLAIGTAGFTIYYFKRKLPMQMTNMKLIASVNPEYVSMQYTPDEWEVPRERIIQLQELGQGSFGMVYAGIIKDLNKPGEEIRCAIKTVNENATDRERINFLKEASVMKGFDTFHVVKLIGVVSSGQPTLVVMELMGNGDLKGYLRSHRPDRDSLDGPAPQPPSLRRVYQMAIEIADGMAYLAFKKFVHRDLAARNCMVADDLTVKIGDFGMTRDIYETDYYRKGTKGKMILLKNFPKCQCNKYIDIS